MCPIHEHCSPAPNSASTCTVRVFVFVKSPRSPLQTASMQPAVDQQFLQCMYHAIYAPSHPSQMTCRRTEFKFDLELEARQTARHATTAHVVVLKEHHKLSAPMKVFAESTAPYNMHCALIVTLSICLWGFTSEPFLVNRKRPKRLSALDLLGNCVTCKRCVQYQDSWRGFITEPMMIVSCP